MINYENTIDEKGNIILIQNKSINYIYKINFFYLYNSNTNY